MSDNKELTWFHPLFINDCDVGWRFNENSGQLVPPAAVEQSAKTFRVLKIIRAYSFGFEFDPGSFYKFLLNIFTPSYHFIDSIVQKNQNVYKFMDFLIENASVGYVSFIECFSREINFNQFPSNPSHVQTVQCGLQMMIIFNKEYNQLFEADDDGKFLEKIWKKEQEMTDEQKKVECSVLVFSLDATKTNVFKMSMKEILKFIEEYQNGSHREYERHLYYALKKIPLKVSEMDDSRFDLLTNLIFPLYWQKKILEIEILQLKVKPVGEKFTEIVKKKKEKLDSCYIKIKNLWDQGIRRCSELLAGGLTWTESDLFAEFSFDHFEKMMDDLEIDENTEDQKIIMNKSDFLNLDWKMALLLKMDVILSNDALQPFVKTQDSNERVLLGFGSHQNRTKPNTIEGSEMFVSPCPLECSINDRQWICINCGEFFKADGVHVICSCGRAHVTNLKLECFDFKHSKEFCSCEKPDRTSASSIASSRRSSFSAVNDAKTS